MHHLRKEVLCTLEHISTNTGPPHRHMCLRFHKDYWHIHWCNLKSKHLHLWKIFHSLLDQPDKNTLLQFLSSHCGTLNLFYIVELWNLLCIFSTGQSHQQQLFLLSHKVPLNPAAHEQLNLLTSSKQVPLLKHGSLTHSSMLSEMIMQMFFEHSNVRSCFYHHYIVYI